MTFNQKNFILLLAGGVGAAKFIDGVAHVMDQKELKIIVNTGDDIELFGLRICPDLDIITYTLANIIDREKGWGFKDESFNSLKILKKYYDIGWFNAGDKDLATHIYRTDLFKRGFSKAEITKRICQKLGVKAKLIPMCNEDTPTYIETPKGKINFEQYYIKEACKPEVLNVIFKGIEKAKPVKGTIQLIKNAKKIIICPSNPIVSIGTILAVPDMRKHLRKVSNKIIGISPIIEGATVKGPADKLMKWKGLDVSCFGVAKYYQDILSYFIIDIRDKKYKKKIERELGINTYTFDTLMVDLKKKKKLARFVLGL
ncbi:MAG: 2-phospho-L-lactate transferase [Promethearchaeota archaeon]|nr:MAG: 2-phospho-L-lactate transferase [Candidatus Lokiarchaeota archaeon]